MHKIDDSALIHTVATVRGTISLQGINPFEWLRLSLPPYSLPILFAFLAIAAYLRHRRKNREIVPVG